MSHRIGFGVVASLALLVLGPACQKNGEAEMRPASGTNSDYRPSQENPGLGAPPLEPPTPGSGSGVPGTQTTPGANGPGEPELDPSQHPPPRYPTGANPDAASDAASSGAAPMAGGSGGARPIPGGKAGAGGHHSH
jgi:hypothetical protein